MAAAEAFKHSTPELYDRYMSPLFFEPSANVVADLVADFQPRTILETAAGTGIVTRAVHDAVPSATITATDLNPGMLEVAARRLRSDGVSFQVENAQNLSFASDSFDVVLCQFGIMFFPDRVGANEEAYRVLRSGGRYLMVAFDVLDRNPVAKIVGEAVGALFPDDPPTYMERGPFCYTDPNQIEHDLRAAGFTQIEIQTRALRSQAANAYEAALGICQGGPFRTEIERRDPQGLDGATSAAAQALHRLEGPNGLDAPMSAHFIIATK
jgi:ubiquinone/menaquinone biosynthesis C-methylase UbiE